MVLLEGPEGILQGHGKSIGPPEVLFQMKLTTIETYRTPLTNPALCCRRHCWRKPWPKSCRLILSLILAQAEVEIVLLLAIVGFIDIVDDDDDP